jgi:glycosidase
MKRFLPFLLLVLAACSTTPKPEEPTTDPTDTVKANTTIIYECNERLFAQQKAFNKIQEYLPDLREMGVEVLWLMPIHPRGRVNSVGSPYCIRDFCAVESAFGSKDDLRALVNDAHSRGMRVILDWVANHTAWDHGWVDRHPDWYQEAETSDERSWNDVAFLNYSVPAVCDTMTDCMLYWVNEFGIDGFRCDYAHGVPQDFWQSAIAAVRAVRPGALFIAETSKSAYYNAGFDMLYSWNYLAAIQQLYAGNKTFKQLQTASKGEYNMTPEGKERMRYITTHDASAENAPSEFYTNADGELSAFCLTAFLGGIPMIYSSQEIGHMAKINFFDYKILTFSKSKPATKKLIALTQAYIASANLRAGEKETGLLTDAVPYIQYRKGESALLVLCNTTRQSAAITYPAAYQGQTVTDLLTGETLTLAEGTTLAGYGYQVFRMN